MGVPTFLAPHLVEWYTDIYRNIYGIDHTYTDIVLKFNTYFKQLVNNTVLTTFSNIILTIGLCLMLLYFFTDLSSKAVMKQLSQLQVWKSFSVLILSVLVIYNAKYIFVLMLTIVEGISSMGDVKSGSVAISKFLSSDVVQLLLSRCVGEHFSLWSIIGYTFSGFILELANLAVKAMLIYYAATRTLQLFVYYIFAPIGVADIFENGPGGTINFRSSGFRYLKTVFAIMLQIVVISVVCNVYPLVGRKRLPLKKPPMREAYFYVCGSFGYRVSSKLSSGPPFWERTSRRYTTFSRTLLSISFLACALGRVS